MTVLERSPSLGKQAAEEIRSRIISGSLQLGEPLSEIALAAQLGVSKTPVREALMSLKREGLVDVFPQRGTFVFTMTKGLVVKLSETRIALEVAALEITLRRNRCKLVKQWANLIRKMEVAMSKSDMKAYIIIDGHFHMALFELSENPFLCEAFALIGLKVEALRNRLSVNSPLNDRSLREHTELLALCRRNEAAGMKRVLVQHITATCENYIAQIDSHRGTHW